MLILGLISFVTIYVAACAFRWHFARHYEPRFRLPSIPRLWRESEIVLALVHPAWFWALMAWLIISVFYVIAGLIEL